VSTPGTEFMAMIAVVFIFEHLFNQLSYRFVGGIKYTTKILVCQEFSQFYTGIKARPGDEVQEVAEKSLSSLLSMAAVITNADFL
jgi:hypothetical protein